MASIDQRLRKAEGRLGTIDGQCHCPDRDRYIPFGHVDSRGVFWLTNPETCPACGGSTVTNPDAVMRIIDFGEGPDLPLDARPFGGWDRWHPWGPPPGRREEIIATGIADEVERTRTAPGEWSRPVFVSIAELMEEQDG
jgi:hypothetical protein